MRVKLLYIAFPSLALLNSRTEGSVCVDSPLPTTITEGSEVLSVQCSYFDEDACKRTNISTHCPATCNTCSLFQCRDSEASFLGQGNTVVSCSAMTEMPNETVDMYCGIVQVANTCRRTCDYCRKTVMNFDEVITVNTEGYGKYENPLIETENMFWYHTGLTAESSGFELGTISAPNSAFNGFGDPVSFKCNDGSFNFNSATLTPAWNGHLRLSMKGYTNDGREPSLIKELGNLDEPIVLTEELEHFTDLHSLSIHSHSKERYAQKQFAMDDLEIEIVSPCVVV